MKKRITRIAALLILPLMAFTGTTHAGLGDKFKDAVKKQHEGDLAKRDEILRKIRGFQKDINGLLKRGDSKTNIDIPIDTDKITDVDDQKHRHSFKDVKPVHAWVNADNVNMRTAGSLREQVIAKAEFAEKVEVIAQTEELETIGGQTSRWVLVRKENEVEGWLFGSFLDDKKPERKAEPEKEEKRQSSSEKGFMVPTEGHRSSNFGYRVDPISKKRQSFHRGIDIACPTGTPVKAAAAGEIVRSEFNQNGYGNLIVIKHEDNVSSYYAHLSKRVVNPGQKVAAGVLIGNVGSTGRSSGPHLHFEVRKGETAMNPNDYLP